MTEIVKSDLPSSWLSCSLGQIVDYGKTEKAEPSEIEAAAWVLELEDIEKDTSRLLSRITFADRQSKSTKNRFESGDVLYGKLRPYLNKVIVADQPGYCTTEIIPLKGNSALHAPFLFYWLKHPVFLDYVSNVSHGLNMPRLGTEAGKAAPLVLAPLAEQKRIADKLEAVLGRVDTCRTRLDRVPDLLKRFRQSVLAAATSGQLTEDWRQSPQASIATVEEYLEQLSKLRLDTWEATPRALAGRRYVEPEPMDSRDLPTIPDSWRWTSVDAVSNQVTDGEHIQPPYQNVGLPMLSAKHVRDGYVDPMGAGLIAEQAFHKALERCAPINGDLLIVSVGATTGRVAIIENCLPFVIVRSVLLVKPLISNRYLLRWLQSSWCYQKMTKASGASAQAHLYIKDTKRLPVPIPPLLEQQEIVRRVDALFALADKIEDRLATAQRLVERLTPATLSKAFRGELVPQDPSDEPASVMLERLRSESPAPADRNRKPRSLTPPKAEPKPSPLPAKPQAAEFILSGILQETPAAYQAVSTKQASLPPATASSKVEHEATTDIADLDKNDLMAVLRETLAAHGPCDRDTCIRQTAYHLGYQRAGPKVSEIIDNTIRTAARRCIILSDNGLLHLNRASITAMEADDRSFVKGQFLAALSQHGRIWIERDEAARLLATWFGFRRAGPQIQDTAKSLINGLLRDYRLESSGTCIRRI